MVDRDRGPRNSPEFLAQERERLQRTLELAREGSLVCTESHGQHDKFLRLAQVSEATFEAAEGFSLSVMRFDLGQSGLKEVPLYNWDKFEGAARGEDVHEVSRNGLLAQNLVVNLLTGKAWYVTRGGLCAQFEALDIVALQSGQGLGGESSDREPRIPIIPPSAMQEALE